MTQTSESPLPGLPFRKMHGAGNDFVVIDSRGRGGAAVTPALAQALGDRHRGVGFDQLAEIRDDADGATIALDFWNADGTMAGACGNATRCVADLVMGDTATIRTARGLLFARREGGQVAVNMGPPILEPAGIPVAGDVSALPGNPMAVGMGNPHCVFFVPEAEAVDLAGEGPTIEHHPLFPARTNVEYVSVIGPDRLRVRVWERGTGITLACGSGACAVAVAAHLRGLTGQRVTLAMDGGDLVADWRDDGVWLTGPVAMVFQGVLAPGFGS